MVNSTVYTKKQNGLQRFGVYQPDEVLPFVCFCGPHNKRPKDNTGKILPNALKKYGNYDIWMTSVRYQLFATKGLVCCQCGVKGSFFALEVHPKQISSQVPHFNLYGIDSVGDEVLLTKDHIIPKSKGGVEQLKNLQVLCYPCNYTKGNTT